MSKPTILLRAAIGTIAGAMLFGAGTARAVDVSIVGTADGVEIIRSIALAYSASTRSVRILVPPSIGSRSAIAMVGSGHESLGWVAGSLLAGDEMRGLQVRPVARLPVAVVTHRSLSLTGLRSSQLADLLAGRVLNWKQLGGPDLRVKVVRRDESDPTWTIFRNSIPELSALVLTERAKLSTSAKDVLESVASNPGAIGIVPYSRIYAHVVKALALDGHHPGDKAYPAFVTLAMIYRPGSLSSEASGFVAFAASDESARIAARFGADPVGHR